MKHLFYLSILIAVILLTMLLPNARSAEKIIDKEFIAVNSYLILASIFDVESTFSAIHRDGCREANPIMRPFVNSGRPATYAFILATDAVAIFISYEIKKSSNKDLRKIWWVGPAIIGTAHGVAGGLNCRYAW